MSDKFLWQERRHRMDACLRHAVCNVGGSHLLVRIDPRSRVAAVLADDGADVDDPPCTGCLHLRHPRLATQERSLEIDAKDAVPLGFGKILGRSMRYNAGDI